MGEQGLVISKNDNLIEVKLKRSPACEKCKACIAFTSNTSEMILSAKNNCNANVGDWVNIELQQSGFFKAVGIMYALPLGALVLGFLVGYYVFPVFGMTEYREVISIVLGFSLTALTYFIINKRENHWKQTMPKPYATNVVEYTEKKSCMD